MWNPPWNTWWYHLLLPTTVHPAARQQRVCAGFCVVSAAATCLIFWLLTRHQVWHQSRIGSGTTSARRPPASEAHSPGLTSVRTQTAAQRSVATRCSSHSRSLSHAHEPVRRDPTEPGRKNQPICPAEPASRLVGRLTSYDHLSVDPRLLFIEVWERIGTVVVLRPIGKTLSRSVSCANLRGTGGITRSDQPPERPHE